MSSLVSFVKLCWAYPWLAPALIVAGFVAYKALGRRWLLNRQIAQHRLEQRRRAGIPDSDTRPWLIARPAAELRLREEARDRAEAKARAEAEAAEKQRLEEKRHEVDEWGHRIVDQLRTMQSTGELTPRRITRHQVVDGTGSPGRETERQLPAQHSSRARPSALHAARTAHRASGVGQRQPSIRKSMAKKRGRNESPDEDEEEHRERETRRRLRLRKPKPVPTVEEEMDEIDSDDSDMALDDESGKGNKRRHDDDEEPRKRRRRSVSDSMSHESEDEEMHEEMETDESETEPEVKIERMDTDELETTTPSKTVTPGATPGPKALTPAKLHHIKAPDDLPVYGADVPDLAAATRRTDAAGVKWLVTPYVEFRQADIRIPARKYRMPRDSEHPDARTNAFERVRVWVAEDVYDALKKEGRLTWQEQEESPEPSSPAELKHSKPQAAPRATGRIGIRSGPPSRPDSPFTMSPRVSRIGSPAPRRQLSEAGRARRHDELLAKLGKSSSPSSSIPLAASTVASPVEEKRLTAEDKGKGKEPAPFNLSTPATSSPLKASTVPEESKEPGKNTVTKPPFSFGPALSSPSTTPASDKKEEKKDSAKPFSFDLGTPSKTGASKEAPKPFSFDTPPNPASEPKKDAVPFSFSVPAAKEEPKEDVVPKPEAAKPFSFDTPSAPAPKTEQTKSFSFGMTSSISAAAPVETPSIGAGNGGFSFGKLSSTSTAPTETPSLGTGSGGFSFGKPSSTPSAAPAETPSLGAGSGGFSFGKPSSTSTAPAETPSLGAGIGGFSFGAPSKSAETPALGKSSFSFGAPSAPAATNKPSDEKPKTNFSFGAPSAPADKAKASFSFGAPAPPTATATSAPAETTAISAKPSFSFGSSPAITTAPAETPVLGAGKSGFSFGAPSAAAPGAPATAGSSGFSFGAPSAPKASFSFDTPSTAASPAPTAGGFSLGNPANTLSSSGDRPAFSFGSPAPSASAPAFSFGSASSNPPPTPGSAFSFGSSSPAPGSGFSFGTGGERTIKPLKRVPK